MTFVLGLEIGAERRKAQRSAEAAPLAGAPAKPDPAGAEPARVWCDGSCAPNPGPGGWAALIERGGRRERISGAAPRSTNNMMEMTAAIEALRHIPPQTRVHITTDSQYLLNGITRWLAGWKRKGWRKADGEPVLNRTLWEELDRLVSDRKVTWEWTRGHSGHPENEEVDRLANLARNGL
jgi:ribonuclease HI